MAICIYGQARWQFCAFRNIYFDRISFILVVYVVVKAELHSINMVDKFHKISSLQ